MRWGNDNKNVVNPCFKQEMLNDNHFSAIVGKKKNAFENRKARITVLILDKEELKWKILHE